MTIARKKNSRMRGSKTHGGGSMKKRRGAGHRGGRGKAGSGKRGDAKKPVYWKDTKYFRKKKFTVPNKKETLSITLKSLDTNLNDWVKNKKASLKEGSYEVNLQNLGYNKLIGTGEVKNKIVVHVNKATLKAKEGVESLGGKIVLLLDKKDADKKES